MGDGIEQDPKKPSSCSSLLQIRAFKKHKCFFLMHTLTEMELSVIRQKYIALIKKYADTGSPTAEIYLADAYQNGTGVSINYELAML